VQRFNIRGNRVEVQEIEKQEREWCKCGRKRVNRVHTISTVKEKRGENARRGKRGESGERARKEEKAKGN
jgi:hypothetical protein